MAVLAENRRAKFDYDILDTYEAGLVLSGHEVKAIKAGRMSLAGSFVIIRRGEAWLVGATVAPYQPKNLPEGYDPQRTRKLLLRREELKELIGRGKEGGLTFVPLKVYTQNAKLKLAFALARGRKKQDKREVIKRREAEREMKARLKYR